MKLAIIGAGGARTPLLVNGLTRSDLPIREIRLFDPDRARLAVMADLARRRCGNIPITTATRSADAIAGADFVFISIRAGGIAARAHDEATAMAHGIVGQETVGPGGFAKAMRTVPHVVAYAREVQAHAPQAWVINFTNPVGIVTQAVRTATGARVIGICDTPTELFEEVCHALDVPSAESYVDYFGLNHLGWVREVYYRGIPQIHRLWEEPDRLARIYRTPLFALDFLRDLRLLPTEYVYYYYRAADAYANVARTGVSRARVIEDLNRQLFADLASPSRDPVDVYERYIAARDAGYMQIESGSAAPRAKSLWSEVTGYDKIALNTVRGIHFNSNAVIPLNVENRGNLPDLADDDVIEVPCVVNGNGALPLHSGSVPKAARDLLVQVKAYERLTVEAALTRDRRTATRALAGNPLVPDAETAERLVSALVLD
ncbi:MAG: 6-phospho-beta-glucosidase [Acidobacteria bacterium]|nr:6-phospho-beta-glucosidase [Acidobacteriota bacterium]